MGSGLTKGLRERFLVGGIIKQAGAGRQHASEARQIGRYDDAFVGEREHGRFQCASRGDVFVRQHDGVGGSQVHGHLFSRGCRHEKVDGGIAGGILNYAGAEPLIL